MSDITDAGGTALAPTGGAGGGGLISKFIDLGGAAREAAKGITTLTDAEAKLDATKKQLIADTQFLTDQTKGHARAIEDTSVAMKSAAYDTTVLAAAQQGSTATTQDGIAAYGTSAKIISLVLAPATKAATDGLIEMMKAQNLYTASLQNTLSIATGWSDYLANLVDAYQSGSTSILAYKQALESFLLTLETQFPTATGKAKAALQEMIATVQRLINTAGAGPAPSTDFSAGGALNKQFNTPPGKP
jgi:hypothetical protein